MSDHWDEFNRRADAWQRAGDTERFRLVELHQESYRYRETKAERKLELLTQERDEARRLGEPWWVLFFEHSRLGTLTADLHDFARVDASGGGAAGPLQRPGRAGALPSDRCPDAGLYAFLQVDPVGHRRDLEEGFAYLDAEVPEGPGTARYVFDYRRGEYLCETERWEEACELSYRASRGRNRAGRR